jgi:hypothetical protein
MYEGYGPNGVALMIECLTDNKNRAAAEVRTAQPQRRNARRPRIGRLQLLPQGRHRRLRRQRERRRRHAGCPRGRRRRDRAARAGLRGHHRGIRPRRCARR